MKSLITYILIFISILSIDMFGTEYYSIASGTFSDIKLDNWSTTRDGLGDNPTDYVTSGDIFYIQVSQTVYADEAVTFGAGVTLEVENGGVLKQNADFSIIFDPSATFRINAGGTLWQNSTDGASIVAGIEDWKPLSLVKVTNTGLFKSTDLTSGYQNLTINHTANIDAVGIITAVHGDLIINQTNATNKTFSVSATKSMSLTVDGSVSITKGILKLSSITASVTLNIGGDFTISTGTALQTTGASVINFTKPGTVRFVRSGTISASPISFAVSSGCTIDMASSFIGSATGSFTLNSGAGIITAHTSGIALTGSTGCIQVTGTRTFSTGANYEYNGGSAQITGTGLPSTVSNLTFNNASGVTLTNAVSVSNVLDLIDGIITAGVKLITVTNKEAIAVTRTYGYINGTLKRAHGTSAGTYLFPIGTATAYRGAVIDFTSAPTAIDNLSAYFSETDPGNSGTPLGSCWSGGYWSITSDGTPGGTYTLSLDVFGIDGVDNTTQIIKRPNPSTVWTVAGTYRDWIITEDIDLGPIDAVITHTGVTSASSFTATSQFTLGGDNGALPVELTSFSAITKEKKVFLKWRTATEVQNYGFDIERKADNDKWVKLGFVKGYGNSNSPREYSFTDSKIKSGTLIYRLKQIDFDGIVDYSNTIEVKTELPDKFSLAQNYPNPFNPVTKINFTLPQESVVKMTIYSSLGQKVKELLNDKLEAGYHEAEWDASQYPSGIYFYQLTVGNFESVKKMILIK